MGGFEAAALINSDVHHDRSRFHGLHHITRHELRSGSAWDKDRTN
jgi:hypothetical protein